MSRFVYFLIVFAALLSGLGGCSDSTAPGSAPELDMQLELVDSVSEEGRFRAEASAKNTGDAPAMYWQGCASSMTITLIDENGEEFWVQLSSFLPKCAPQWQALLPSESVADGVDLVSMWGNGGALSPIPPGIYTLRAAFEYYIEPGAMRIE